MRAQPGGRDGRGARRPPARGAARLRRGGGLPVSPARRAPRWAVGARTRERVRARRSRRACSRSSPRWASPRCARYQGAQLFEAVGLEPRAGRARTSRARRRRSAGVGAAATSRRRCWHATATRSPRGRRACDEGGDAPLPPANGERARLRADVVKAPARRDRERRAAWTIAPTRTWSTGAAARRAARPAASSRPRYAGPAGRGRAGHGDRAALRERGHVAGRALARGAPGRWRSR